MNQRKIAAPHSPKKRKKENADTDRPTQSETPVVACWAQGWAGRGGQVWLSWGQHCSHPPSCPVHHGHLGLSKPFQGWLTSKHPPFWTRDSVFLCKLPSQMLTWRFLGFPGGSAVRRSPPNAGDVGLIPDPGRRSMQLLSRCSRAQELHLLKPGHSRPCSAAETPPPGEARAPQWRAAPNPGPCSPPRGDALAVTESQPSSKEVTT